jgi:CRISPR system Cascade subunit CasC
VENEYDYFTAVDDLQPDEETGAGMLGTVEYNAATYYRYATVAVHELFAQLGNNPEALEQAMREFLRAFVNSMPTGKQNTFAANTLPDAVLVVLRTDRPINMVGAFEKPVNPVNGEGLVSSSTDVLEKYAQSIYRDFCSKPVKAYVVGQFKPTLGEQITLSSLLECFGRESTELVSQ